MPSRLVAAILLVIAASATPAAAERLEQASPAGFVSAFRNAANGSSVEEWVPRGETVQRWTRMITVQRFAGVAERASAADYVQTVAEGLPDSCPGAQVGAIGRLVISGQPAARVRVDCPRNPSTSLPETFFLLAIAGQSDMHVAQVAFRRVPTRADVDFARQQLESVQITR